MASTDTGAALQQPPRRRRAAFLSMDNTEGWWIYDDKLVEPLAAKGWDVTPRVPWRSFATHDWSVYDVVVVRSPWDYQEDLALFHKCLDHIRAAGPAVENDVALMKWNSAKMYLRDMAADGCPTLPTVYIDAATTSSSVSSQLAKALEAFPEVVIKPAVGASSFDTYRVKASELEAPFTFVEEKAVLELRGRPTALPDGRTDFARKAEFFDGLFAGVPCLIQPYIAEVASQGEFSLFFFAGKFSHAMLKVPKDGDFRVQEEYGAEHRQLQASDIPEGVTNCAARAMAALPVSTPPLYCRVDVVALSTTRLEQAKSHGSLFSMAAGGVDVGYALMEVELIEPSLYFNIAAEAVGNFCDAFVGRFGTP